MGFFKALVHNSNPEVDSMIVLGLAAMFAFVAYAGYAVYQDFHSFNPLSYGTGAASILAGVGGGRRLRDGPPDQGDGK